MHSTLTFSALPLFIGALLCDWAYAQSFQVQWLNFAAWLNAGGLLMAGLALLAALIHVARFRDTRQQRSWVYLGLLVASFVFGFVNALIHGKDGFATMPSGLVLSAVVLAFVAAASVIGMLGLHRRTA